MHTFVVSDPDRFKYKLPEIEDYIQFDENSAGSKTHKESGLISEIVTMVWQTVCFRYILVLHYLLWLDPWAR